MNIDQIINEINYFKENSGRNEIMEDVAFRPDLVGMKIYEEALVGVCSADDEYIKELVLDKDADVKKSFVLMDSPKDWLPESSSVISIFMPFTEQVKKSNRGGDEPSDEWLHARIEGQTFISEMTKHIVGFLNEAGYISLAPGIDQRFKITGTKDENARSGVRIASNWSERHIAFATGLGTFSLSDSFITEKGSAGRITSIITSLEFPSELYEKGKNYKSDIYGNCTKCGVCIKNCPVDAITLEKGHDHGICSKYLDGIREKNPPYYGCGKCQTKVPCESRIPKATK